MVSKRLNSLRRRIDFETLRSEGIKYRVRPWLLVQVRPTTEDNSRFGWTISRKVGNAVVRNRLKRWCREFVRSRLDSFTAPADFNIVFLPQKQSPEFFRHLEHKPLEDALEKFVTLYKKNSRDRALAGH